MVQSCRGSKEFLLMAIDQSRTQWGVALSISSDFFYYSTGFYFLALTDSDKLYQYRISESS